MASPWIWSDRYRQWYYRWQDAAGNWQFLWASQLQAPQSSLLSSHHRNDSGQSAFASYLEPTSTQSSWATAPSQNTNPTNNNDLSNLGPLFTSQSHIAPQPHSSNLTNDYLPSNSTSPHAFGLHNSLHSFSPAQNVVVPTPAQNTNHANWQYNSNVPYPYAEGGGNQINPSEVFMPVESALDPADSPSDEEDESGRPVFAYNAATDPRYMFIRDPRAFFKKGRIFMVLWTEPHGQQATHFSKIRMFVVIRPKSTHTLCHPIHTYSKQGTAKRGVNPNVHAALVHEGEAPQYQYNERPLAKHPLDVIIEDDTFELSPWSRINFGKVSTVENNIKVRKIGRIAPQSLGLLERYFQESLGINHVTNEDVWNDV